MSFIVEDGTGMANATSFASVAEFDAYHADRGNNLAGLTQTIKENLLIKATDYIELRWGIRFKGFREFSCQALSFPRLGLYNRDGIVVAGVPAKLKYATAEYALKLNTTELFPDVDDRTQQVIGLMERVGPIIVESKYSSATSSASSPIKPYPAADRYLLEYVISGAVVERA